MTTIVTRAGKGSPLTWNEGDANFNNLNSAVIDAQTTADAALVAATTTFTSVAVGVVPASGGGTTNFLRADGTFAAPAGTSIAVKDEGVTLTSAVSSIDFVGAGVSATNTGDAVTVTIAGGGGTPGGSSTQVQYNNAGAFGGISNLTTDGTNITFGNGALIKGNWDTATVADRPSFQTSTSNQPTSVQFIPNGTAQQSGLLAFNRSDPTNAAYIGFYCDNTAAHMSSGVTGTGTALPIYFVLNANWRGSIQTNGNWNIGSTLTDPGVLLRVQGTFRATGNSVFGFDAASSSWGGSYSAMEVGRVGNALMAGTAGANVFLISNAYYNGTNWKYANNTSATGYLWLKDTGGMEYAYAAAGTAGNNVTYSTLFSIDTAGSVTITGASVPQNSQSAAYTLVAADANKHILHPSADTTARVFTIPANSSVPFAIGTAITFVNQNGAGTITISITTDTMRLAGPGTTGSRTLAANGIATALKITSTEWIISGTGLT